MWTRPEVRPTFFLRLGEQAAGLGWERLTPGVDWWTKTVHERKAVHGRMHAPGRPAREAGRQAHLCSAEPYHRRGARWWAMGVVIGGVHRQRGARPWHRRQCTDTEVWRDGRHRQERRPSACRKEGREERKKMAVLEINKCGCYLCIVPLQHSEQGLRLRG